MNRGPVRSWIAPLSVGAASTFLLLIPAIFVPKMLSGDSPIHILWQSQFAAELWRGTLYPRWLPDMNHGLGSPAYFFYPPLLQFTAAAFEPLFGGPAHATVRTALALWALGTAGALGTWTWLKALRLGPAACLLGLLFYAALPYRAYFDIYQRGALPELAGLSVMPWLLAFAQRLANGARGAWGGYALATGLILWSHLPSAEMGILFATAYLLVLPAPGERWQVWWRGAGATVAGFLIGGLCIATALGLLRFIPDPANMWGERQQPVHWLLFAREPWVDPGVRMVVVALCLLSLPMTAALGWGAVRNAPPLHRRIGWFLAASVLVVLLLNTALSRPFWALQTPLSRIQFPFRLLSLHVLAFAGLAGLAFERLATAPTARAAWAGTLLWLALGGLVVTDATLFGFHLRYARNPAPDNAAVVGETRDTGEYVLGSIEEADALVHGRAGWGIDAPATVTARRQSRDLALAVDAARPTRLALRQFAFSGWRCRVDGGDWTDASRLPLPLNLPVCAVPAGRHRLEAVLPATAVERLGGAMTAVGLLLAVADLSGLFRRRPRPRGAAPG